MNKDTKKLAIGIGILVIGTVILKIIDAILAINIFRIIWSWIVIAFEWLVPFLNYLIPVWWILVAVIALAFSGFLIWRLKKKKIKNFPQPEYFKFTEANYDQIVYRWHYAYAQNSDNYFRVWNIKKFCSQCDCELVDAKCPNCSSSFYLHQKDKREIMALIFHDIRKRYVNKYDSLIMD